jgi:hypothetical protein
MNQDEALSLLGAAQVEKWNKLRSEGEQIPSLAAAELRDVDLRGANLRGADLGGAVLCGAKLSGADLSRACLTGADLTGADLRQAVLVEADLRWAKLIEADLHGSYLRGAKLDGADFSRAKLSRGDLIWIDTSTLNLHSIVVVEDESVDYRIDFGGTLRCESAPAPRSPTGVAAARARRYWKPHPVSRVVAGSLRVLRVVTVGWMAYLRVPERPRDPLAPGLPLHNHTFRRIKAMARRVSLVLGQLMLRQGRRIDPVDCTVFAPPRVARGDSLWVQVFAHRPEQAEQASSLAQEMDDQARRRGFKSLEVGIERGTRLTFHLHVPGISFAAPSDSLLWEGRPAYVQFIAKAPLDLALGNVFGRVTVSRDALPVGSIMFRLEIVEKNGQPPAPNTLLGQTHPRRRSPLLPVGDVTRRYHKAFISYASQDRSEVLKRVQMLRLARIRYFQDVLKLEPGDRWERKLYRHIDRSDLFLLFWSTNAKESKWVLEEARYAIKRKGGDDSAPPDMIPVIIEGPPVPEPPADLAHLHFNDYLIYFMAPAQAAATREKR